MAEGSIAIATVTYLAYALLAVVGPGLAIQRLLGVKVDRGLVIPLGIAFVTGTYWLSLVVPLPWLFPVLALGLNLWLLRARPWTLAEGPTLRGALPSCLGLVAFLAATQYGANCVGRDGSFVLERLMQEDTSFHVGIVWELSHSYPPQVPGVAGFPLNYHIGLELLQAASVRWAGVHPYDSLNRFDVTLIGLALLLTLRAATHAVGGTPAAVAIVPWTLLASGCAFLFGLPDLERWTGLLDGSLVFELAYASSVIPAVALTLGAVVALCRYESGEGRGWLAVAAILSLAVPFFKVFMGAQFLLGFAVAALLVRPALAAAVPALLTLLGTAALVLGDTGRAAAVSLATSLPTIRPYLGRPQLEGGGLVLWTAGWILACLGLRLLGLPALLRCLASRSGPAVTLAVVALSGWPLALLFQISFTDENPFRSVVNHSHYFVEQSGPPLWIFASLALGRLGLRSWRAVGVGALCAGLAFPGTAEFVMKSRRMDSTRVPPAIVEAMAALRKDSHPGDVVLEKQGARRYPPPPLVFIGRRVPYSGYITYLTHLVPKDELDRRRALVRRFFETADVKEAATIARGLGATHLCLYGSDRILFEGEGLLRPVYEEPNARVYRFAYPAAGRPR